MLICCVLYRDQYTIQIQRFFDKIVCSFPDGFDGRVDCSVTGNHDYRGIRGEFLDTFQYFDTFHFGHFYITENNVGFFRFHGNEPFHSVFSQHDFVSLVL